MKLMILNLPVRNLSFFNLPKLTTFIIFNLPGTLLLWTYDFQFIPETYNFQSTSVKLMIFNLPLWRFSIYFGETYDFQFTPVTYDFQSLRWNLWFSIYLCESYDFQFTPVKLITSNYLCETYDFQFTLWNLLSLKVNWKS